jgi:predicted dehydrogenase
MEAVRIGVVGCGNVLEVGYMPIIDRLRSQELAELVMACDVREEMRQLVEERFHVARFTTDYHKLLESRDVDLVLVLTDMPSHGPISQQALEAGKHVLVEKPMAVTLEQAKELVETSRRSHGYLVPAPFVTLSPTFQTMAFRIRQGDIGNVLTARARYGWTGPWWGKFFYQKGGGALFDLAVYNLTSLTGLIGPVKRVSAMTGIAIPQRVVDGELIKVEVEDNAHILLDFGESVFGAVTTGFTMQQYRSPAIEIYGGEGTIQMLGDDWRPQGYELWRNHVGAWMIFSETDPGWPWCDGLNHLVECIHQGAQPLITPEHAYHVLEIMIRAQEAGRLGRSVSVESTFTLPDFPKPQEGRPAHMVNDPSYRR